MFPFNLRTSVALGASWLNFASFGLQASNTVGMKLRGTPAEPVIYSVHLIREIEHVGSPFTQGLEFTEDCERLIETSGSYPSGVNSFVRTLDPQTGEVLMTTTEGLDGRFVEGIVQLEAGAGAHWFATTYTDHKAVEYDSELNQVDEHTYNFEGWGFSRNADRTAFLATNSSSHIMELAPDTFEVASIKTATCYGNPVEGINELEMVHDFQGSGHPALLGNVYTTRVVIALDPSTMNCIGLFHLEGLGSETSNEGAGFHVANGIAFNQHTGNYVVTGKNWDQMFEISLEAESMAQEGRARELLVAYQAPHALLQTESPPTVRIAQPHAQGIAEVF